MRKVATEGRSLHSASPFAIEAIACSRTPKWKLRPPGADALWLPASGAERRVFVEGARSAEPPRSQGIAAAAALSALPEASRVATPFASAGKTGAFRSHP